MESQRSNSVGCPELVPAPPKVQYLTGSCCLVLTEYSRWSFGGNRLQIKAEEKVLSDVAYTLTTVSGIASQTQRGCYRSLLAKQELLHVFVENERSRLKVWLSPLEPERKHYMSPISGSKSSLDVSFFPTSLFAFA